MPRFARLPHAIKVVALAVAMSGCQSSADAVTEPSHGTTAPGFQAGYVSVTPSASGLEVVNHTERPIYLFAVNAEMMALIDLAPCTGGANCPALARGARRDIPWADVYMYAPNVTQLAVYWWQVVVLPDGTARAENLHHVTVTR